MDAEELLKRYSNRERNFAGVHFKEHSGRINFKGADLRGINLSGSFLYMADLSGTNLSNAELIGTFLVLSSLKGANLYKADLMGASLMWANLMEADLTQARLTYANLYGAALRNSNLSHAEIDRCILIDTNFLGAKNLEISRMSGLIVRHITLPQGTIEE